MLNMKNYKKRKHSRHPPHECIAARIDAASCGDLGLPNMNLKTSHQGALLN
jgi:hypothetical protein